MIYIDMDGVLADFITGVATLADMPEHGTFGDEPPTGYKLEETFRPGVWDEIDNAGEEWWEKLSPYSWFECWRNDIRDNSEVVLLTAPSLSPHAWSGKVRWIQRHFGRHFRNLVLCPAKHKRLLCHGPTDVLIDDSNVNISQWCSAGGLGVLWPMPWNTARRLPTRRDIGRATRILCGVEIPSLFNKWAMSHLDEPGVGGPRLYDIGDPSPLSLPGHQDTWKDKIE